MSEPRSISRRDALRITAGVGIGAAFGIGIGAEVLKRAGLHRASETRIRMGTSVTLTVVHEERDEAGAMIGQTFAEMERLEAILSRYRPDSAVGRLNESGSLEAAPPELIEVLALSLDVSRRSHGAFDVTVGPLVDFYQEWFDVEHGPPEAVDVDRVLGFVGYRGISIDGETIRFAHDRMAISLDGVAKGYIVDRAVACLTGEGADRVLVDAGGDMTSGGDGLSHEPWTIGIQHPRLADELVGRVQLNGGSIATSGDYVRHFTPDHRHYDILDPRTGRSPGTLSSATVLAPTAAEADALSTAVLVLPPREGLALIDEYEGAECLLISKTGEDPLSSHGMAARLG
ncbi:MAG: FAD:protein FMN transferase [Longimicrobiales bacterium]